MDLAERADRVGGQRAVRDRERVGDLRDGRLRRSGERGRLPPRDDFHSTGSGTWTVQDPMSQQWFWTLWGTGGGTIYAVGQSGAVLQLAAGSWTTQFPGAPNQLLGLWGSGSGDAYSVGAQGTIVHSTGNGSWWTQTSPTTSTLWGVWGSGSNDVYVVGTQGTILHKN
jgi:hypothetical protein